MGKKMASNRMIAMIAGGAFLAAVNGSDAEARHGEFEMDLARIHCHPVSGRLAAEIKFTWTDPSAFKAQKKQTTTVPGISTMENILDVLTNLQTGENKDVKVPPLSEIRGFWEQEILPKFNDLDTHCRRDFKI